MTKNHYFLAILALAVIPLSGLSIDIYVPSLPAVSHYFHAEKSLVQLSITTYMLAMGIMQLFAGSISDSFGRRIPFLFAMAIFIVATLCVPLSSDVYQLLILRFLQGASIATTVVPMRSVISDLFTGKDFYKMVNYMTMVWSMGPIVAPAIGGYLQHYFGWQSNFYFLAIYSVITFILILIYLPETSQHRHAFHVGQILRRYREILFHPVFFSGLIMNGLLYSFIILFGIVGPFYLQTILHYTPIEFGHIALLMGLAWFIGTMTNRFLIHVPITTKAKFIFSGMLLVVLIALGFVLAYPTNAYTLIIPLAALLWLGGIIFPNYFAKCVGLFPKTTGSANAIFGAFTFLIAGISSSVGSLLKSTSALPLTLTYLVLVGLCIINFLVITKWERGQIEDLS